MNWLDTLTDWGFGIAVIRFLVALFFSFVTGYYVGSYKSYSEGIRDGAGVRKSSKSATFDEFTAKREQNVQKRRL